MKEIELTHGKVALVDDDDFEHLSQWNWFAHKAKYTYYARRTFPTAPSSKCPITKRMHREIFEFHGIGLGDLEVDHINGNGLDNRKSNLRIVKHQENNWNSRKKPSRVNSTHGFKGITFARGHWCAQLLYGGRHIHIGYYSTPEDAAAAYDEAAKKYFGQFARTNDQGNIQPHVPDTNPANPQYSQSCPKKRKRTTSRYRGVYYVKERNKWQAQITVNGKRISLGRFLTEADAARAYNDAMQNHYGNDPRLNKI